MCTFYVCLHLTKPAFLLPSVHPHVPAIMTLSVRALVKTHMKQMSVQRVYKPSAERACEISLAWFTQPLSSTRCVVPQYIYGTEIQPSSLCCCSRMQQGNNCHSLRSSRIVAYHVLGPYLSSEVSLDPCRGGLSLHWEMNQQTTLSNLQLTSCILATSRRRHQRCGHGYRSLP